ncbi:hypothetical protein SLA2020_413680 [Shorea laevis]
MAALVAGDFDSEEVFKRQLTANDMKEPSRLYIKKSPACKICPEAFGSTPEETYTRDLHLYDAGFKPWPMAFHRRGNKCYLTQGWGDFITANKLSQGDTIRIHVLTSKRGTGERFFMIGRVMVAGVLIG